MKNRFEKSLLVLLFTFLFGSELFSQISLGPQDFGDIGDEVELYFDSTYLGSQSSGSTGAGQFWNFNLNSNVPDTLRFVNPSSTPFGSDFPNSNLSIQEGISYTFLSKSPIDLKVFGFNLDLDTFFSGASIKINPPITLFQFPANYNDNFSSSGTGSFTFPFQDTFDVGGNPTYVDSVRVDFNVQQQDSINGYGILTIDTSSNEVLRVESWQEIGFSIFAKVEIFPTVFIWVPIPIPFLPDLDVRSVNYYGKGFDYPLLSFELDSAGDIIGNSFQKNPVVNSIGKTSSFLSQKPIIYPNPVKDKIFFEFRNDEVPIEILDNRGKVIKVLDAREIENGLDISDLLIGSYFLKISQGGNRYSFERFIKN